MRCFVCLLVAVVFATGAEAGAHASRPQRGGSFVYHFDDPWAWQLSGSGGDPIGITCKYGCLFPPYSLSLGAHDRGDGVAAGSAAYRLVDEIPTWKTYRVSAWVNGGQSPAETGLKFQVDDIDALSFRTVYSFRSDVYRRDIGPGWQRVQLGVVYAIDFVPDVRWMTIATLNPFGSPVSHWLVGQIEFSPAPDLDDQAPADLP